MIRDAHDANETTKPNDFELTRLRAALPEYFDKAGDFRLDRLQEALSLADVSMNREGYELKFLGKSFAKYLTSTRTETVVVPDLDHNAEPTNAESENLYIVGDNLDALKHLLGSYAGKVKCIYIDPPYNTGTDGFVYDDDFGFTAKDLIEKVGLDEDEAERVMALRGRSSHSAWLTFMYPRLELAKELLADNGVIFISIDDNEQANLRALCDEIFGEQNFVSQIIWEKVHTRKNSARQFSVSHDYVIAFAKRKMSDPGDGGFQRALLPREDSSAYKNTDGDPKGPWKPDAIYANNPYDADYEITKPDGTIVRRPPGQYWRYSEKTIQRAIDDGEIIWGSGASMPMLKRYLSEVQDGLVPTTLFSRRFAGDNSSAKNEIKDLFGSAGFFSYPKPTSLISRLVQIAGVGEGEIVLDFFSGSGTTAEAVLRLNSEDSLGRRFILVQIPDPIEEGSEPYRSGYRTIDEIGRERVKRAAAKIELESDADIDSGFRLFRLEEPSERTLDELESFDPNEDGVLLAGDFVSKFAFNRTTGDRVALSTWLLQDGFGLTPKVGAVKLHEYELQICKDSGYVIEPGLDSDDVVALVIKLETGDLDLRRLVVFGYSVPFSVMHELRQNLKSLRSGQTISVIERY